MFPETEYDVCVVGLGPTGLAMTHLLSMRGLSVLALEREPEFYGMARAVYTDDECLRIMQNAGLADDLHADMVVDLPVQWIDANGDVLAQFHDPRRPNGWPTSNFLYQPDFETTLESALEGRPGVTIRRGRSVLAVDQDGDGVDVSHAACPGANYGRAEGTVDLSTREVARARYLVACDGGRSTIRTGLGVEMAGRRFPQRWLVLDLHAREGADAFRHLPYFDFVCDPQLPTVSCPQPKGRHRFEFMLHDDDVTADFERPEKARELLSRYVDVDEIVIDRQLVYTFNALVAQQWRRGRIFLAGDAAHMTPQFIGQGMNAGLRDADNLSWKIADVINDGADDSILDTYETERRPHATAMMKLSVFNKDVVSTTVPALIRGRDVGLRIQRHVPGLRTFVGQARMKPRPRLRRGGYLGVPRRRGGVEGTLMPQPAVRSDSGRPVRFDDAVGAGWLAIGLGVDPRTHPAMDGELAQARPWTWVSLFEPGSRPQGSPGDGRRASGLVDLEAIDGRWTAWLRRAHARRGDMLLVRPDKYVLGIVRAGSPQDVSTMLDILEPVKDHS